MGVAVGGSGVSEGVKSEGSVEIVSEPAKVAEAAVVPEVKPTEAKTEASAAPQVASPTTVVAPAPQPAPELVAQTITPPTETAPQPKQPTQAELDTELRNTLSDTEFLARFMQFLKIRQPVGVNYKEDPEFSKWLYPELDHTEALKAILSESDWEKVDRILDKCAELVGMSDGTLADVDSDLRERVIPIKVWKFEKSLRFPYRTGAGNKLVYSNDEFSLTVQSGDAGWWQGINFKLTDKTSGNKVGFDSLMQAEPRRAAVINSIVDAVVQFAEDALATSDDPELKRWADHTLKWEQGAGFSGQSRIKEPFLYDHPVKNAV